MPLLKCGPWGWMPLSFKSSLMILMHCNSRKQQKQETEPRKNETKRKTIFQDLSSSPFFSFVILVSLMFDIKDVKIVFPVVVYSVIINLPCKTTASGATSDTKGPHSGSLMLSKKGLKKERGGKKRKQNQKECATLPPN